MKLKKKEQIRKKKMVGIKIRTKEGDEEQEQINIMKTYADKSAEEPLTIDNKI